MPGFTPGKWERDGLNIGVKGRGVIAHIPTPPKGGVFDCDANGRLIAQAPEMYRALKQYIANRDAGRLGDENDLIEYVISAVEQGK